MSYKAIDIKISIFFEHLYMSVIGRYAQGQCDVDNDVGLPAAHEIFIGADILFPFWLERCEGIGKRTVNEMKLCLITLDCIFS
jgi:hypothetical protein